MTDHTMEEKRNHAVLVGLHASSLSQEENASDATLEELEALLETAGGVCVGSVLQNRETPEARTFIGEGKVAEVAALVQAQGADLVVFDNELSPSQQRVLSEELGVQVLDRAALILDIFAQRARTREGRLQVELAQYQYLLPRLLGMWTHLERQEGAIGTRGPGETQLETDRRHIHRKIAKLEDELEQVRRVHQQNKIIYTVVACFLAGLLAQACVGIGFGVNLDLIMIGDIMLFIPGLVIVNGVREFFYADILTGLYRLVEALLIAGAIAAGYAVSLMMGGSL